MPRTETLSSVEIDIAEQHARATELDPEEPFRILVAGNFSGGAGRNRRTIQVDRDNFEQVLGMYSPQLRIPLGTGEVTVTFRELDDFHPDRLFERLGPFHALRSLRRRLADRSTFAAAAAEMAAPPAEEKPASQTPRAASGADVLRMMMGEPEASAAAPATKPAPQSDWDRMLHAMVAPYAEKADDPRQPELIAQTDAAVQGQMQSLMHHPKFQALEAAWRGLYFLVRRLDTGQDLRVYVLDLPQDELTPGMGLADLARTIDSQPFGVVAGIYEFSAADEGTLERISAVVQNANTPFIAGLDSGVVGLDEVLAGLRRSMKAKWIGLALPRFLLRLPYGKDTDETETFAFEEMPSPPRHKSYLWGNPAFACACLLGEAFSRHGWDMRPGMVQEIDGLPLHVYRENGESQLKPCAEVLLSESSAELLLERGFMPLATMKGTDRARLVRFQSIAQPLAALAGRWG
jgi:type VI secretion system protein ImpC